MIDQISNLHHSAKSLSCAMQNLDKNDPVLKRTVDLLLPLIDLVNSNQFSKLPEELPERRFFWGMQEDCLGAWHLDKGSLLGAIYEFEQALRQFHLLST